MRRRDFLGKILTASGAYLGSVPRSAALDWLSAQSASDPSVKRVLAVFKCHFDAGFIDTQANVVRRYFDEYFPKAIQIAESLRQSGGPQYVWTTGSWLLYEYLDQANAEQRKKMEQAIHAGDIAWHALPFTWQTEMLDPTLISGALAISQALDKRFGAKTTGAKMTDVPGHTRGLIAPLAANGVTFLDIGVNEASRPAVLPPIFRWQDSSGASLAVMYHSAYGAVTLVPNSDLVIAIVVRDDNTGPHTLEEISKTYADLKQRFPNAELKATNLSAVANAVAPHAADLPVVTQEIGDTWIHGVGSDPLKVARYREVCRLRRDWLREGKLQAGDATDLQLLRHLLLEVEHTWGTDTKTWLDFENYIPKDLTPMFDKKNYQVVEHSWEEKRRDLFAGIDTLPAGLKADVNTALAALAPKPPVALAKPSDASRELDTPHFLLQLDQKTGAIAQLQDQTSGRTWASPDHPLALFSYQTLSQQDYADFFAAYVISNADWAKKDFGKPNIQRFGAQSQVWKPVLVECTRSDEDNAIRLLEKLQIQDEAAFASGRAAFPKEIFLEYVLSKTKPTIEINLSCFDKPPTRMPEALWLSFHPFVPNPMGWTLQKSGQAISPFDVVECGNRHLHALQDSISYKDADGGLTFTTLDAPLVAIGRQSPLNFSRTQPSFDGGIHFNLFNNAWGTNYIMWYAEPMRFRFLLEML
jgi:Domain of unknown function (DUF5054)